MSAIDPTVFLWLCFFVLAGSVAITVVILIAHSLRNGKAADEVEAASERSRDDYVSASLDELGAIHEEPTRMQMPRFGELAGIDAEADDDGPEAA